MSLGPTNGEVVGALNQGDAPADALDKLLVATAFDWVVRKKPYTNLIDALSDRSETTGP